MRTERKSINYSSGNTETIKRKKMEYWFHCVLLFQDGPSIAVHLCICVGNLIYGVCFQLFVLHLSLAPREGCAS